MTQAPPESTTPARTTLELAAAARLTQLAIRAQLMRDVVRLWPALDVKRLDETSPGWLRAMSLLLRNYHRQSSVAAGAAYRVAREHATESPAPRSLVKLAADPAEEWMNKAFGFSGPGMLKQDTAKPGTALSTTLGTASRVALEGGRNTTLATVDADPVAVGWYRVTDGKPCAFCALLASRGVVYKKASAFDSSNAEFNGAGMSKVHNDCGCGFSPAFTHDHELPAISKTAADVYARRERGIDGLVAFRKAWNAHLARTA